MQKLALITIFYLSLNGMEPHNKANAKTSNVSESKKLSSELIKELANALAINSVNKDIIAIIKVAAIDTDDTQKI